MNRNYERAIATVLKHEGGYVDHPADPGGATNLGITIGTLSSWLGRPATKAEVRALTVKDVAPIYKRNYWDKIQGDGLPDGVDFATFDFAVNSGPGRAAKFLQSIVGAEVDGEIGPQTLQSVSGVPRVRIINELCDRRQDFLENLPTFKTFGKGWTSRVKGVRALALDLAAQTPTAVPLPSFPPPPDIPHYPQAIPIVLPPAAPKSGIGGWIIAAVVIAGAIVALAQFVDFI